MAYKRKGKNDAEADKVSCTKSRRRRKEDGKEEGKEEKKKEGEG